MVSRGNESNAAPTLPRPAPNQTYVKVSPITGGYLTLPDSAFVSPSDPQKKRYVPSLAFLITHPNPPSLSTSPCIVSTAKGLPLRILFDLGLRQQASNYTDPQQIHLSTRSPYELFPGVPETLRRNNIDPQKDIDAVILSHVHYDHHGDPSSYANASFFVGPGSLDILSKGLPPELGSHQHFSQNLFAEVTAREFPGIESGEWKELGSFSHAIDLLGDGSIFVIDTPGHLPGHLNLLCRIAEGKWVCLCGDAFHDPRLLSGEKEIGTWEGEGGRRCCIHLDQKKAEGSIAKLRELKGLGNVELIAAHDDIWADKNESRFFPGHL